MGSTAWLLAHEVRLTWRGAREGGAAHRGQLILLAVMAAVGLFLGVPLGFVLRSVGSIPLTFVSVAIADLVLAAVATLMMAATLVAATEAFYTRGDLDLLLSAPIEGRRVLVVRALVIAFNMFAASSMLITPMLAPIVVISHPAWAASYGVLAALALFATGVGLILTLLLLRLIGPRRTRAGAQVLAAIIGAALFVSSQAQILFGQDRIHLAINLVQRGVRVDRPPAFAYAWPLRAMTGDVGVVALLIMGAGLVFAGACWWVGRSYETQASAANGVSSTLAASSRPLRRFVGGTFAATLHKEWRLLSRDVPLMSQVLLRVLYLLPLVFVSIRGVGHDGTWSLPTMVSAITFMAGQLAGSLAWITVSAEDAPDLIALAPVAPAILRRAKIAAALSPLLLLLAGPLIILTMRSAYTGLVAAVGCVSAAIASGLINGWYQRPARRTEFRRRAAASMVAGLAQFLAGALISAAAGLAADGSILAWAPAVLAVVAISAMSRDEQQMQALSADETRVETPRWLSGAWLGWLNRRARQIPVGQS